MHRFGQRDAAARDLPALEGLRGWMIYFEDLEIGGEGRPPQGKAVKAGADEHVLAYAAARNGGLQCVLRVPGANNDVRIGLGCQ